MEDYLKAFQSLSEKTRLRILALLHQAQEVCVSDLVSALGESQYKVSRHLKVLQDARLVVGDRKGRWIYYRLNHEKVQFYNSLFSAIKHNSSDIIQEDIYRLKQILATRQTCPQLKK